MFRIIQRNNFKLIKRANSTFPNSFSILPTNIAFTPMPTNPLPLELFDERIAVIHACIQSNDLFRAEIIFHHLLRSNMTDLKQFVDAKVFNSFIEGYLSGPN